MKLSEAAEKALDGWMRVETGHVLHDSDMDKFYKFVDQYKKDHGDAIDEDLLREKIEAKVGGVASESPAQDIIRERISLAYSILDFLKCTGR